MVCHPSCFHLCPHMGKGIKCKIESLDTLFYLTSFFILRESVNKQTIQQKGKTNNYYPPPPPPPPPKKQTNNNPPPNTPKKTQTQTTRNNQQLTN